MHLQAWFAQVLLRALNERGHLILSRPCIMSIDQWGRLHTHIVLHSIIRTFSDFAWSSAGDHPSQCVALSESLDPCQASPPIIHITLTIALSASSLYLTILLSTTVAYLLALMLIMITFIVPGVFVWAQKDKK